MINVTLATFLSCLFVADCTEFDTVSGGGGGGGGGRDLGGDRHNVFVLTTGSAVAHIVISSTVGLVMITRTRATIATATVNITANHELTIALRLASNITNFIAFQYLHASNIDIDIDSDSISTFDGTTAGGPIVEVSITVEEVVGAVTVLVNLVILGGVSRTIFHLLCRYFSFLNRSHVTSSR